MLKKRHGSKEVKLFFLKSWICFSPLAVGHAWHVSLEAVLWNFQFLNVVFSEFEFQIKYLF
jgi:hypothetical protein